MTQEELVKVRERLTAFTNMERAKSQYERAKQAIEGYPGIDVLIQGQGKLTGDMVRFDPELSEKLKHIIYGMVIAHIAELDKRLADL